MAKEKQKFETCKKCSQENKPILLVGYGKRRMGFICGCGLTDKKGNKVE